ncbi:MAG: carboxypeptidase-like regulatory domain-containing protein, partial [Candidatus Acidiferrum sp.]
MKLFVRFLSAALLVLGVLSLGIAVEAQTSNSGLVQGTVTDKGGAVVPDATVELLNTATNETKTTTTAGAGEYTFANVPPGTYTLKITKAGFATITFANLKVDVTKTYTYNATLEVSAGKEVIEVTAQAQAELQTADAVVGNVVGESELMRLPTLGRDSRELLTLQPMSTPFES